MEYAVHEANRGRFKGILLWKIYPYFPDTIFVVRIFRAFKFNDKLVDSSQDLNFVVILDSEMLQLLENGDNNNAECTCKDFGSTL